MFRITIAGILLLAALISEASENSLERKKTVNVSMAPLSGFSSFAADFAINEKMSLGPIVGFTSYSSGSSVNVGVALNSMFTQSIFTDGWSLNSGLQYSSAKGSTGGQVSGYSLSAIPQKNWFWSNGFNLNAGLGLQYVSLDLSSFGGIKISGILPAIGFNVGYVF